MENLGTGVPARRIPWRGIGKGTVFLVVGLLLSGWLVVTPPGLLGKADAIGYAVCHRIDLRSFHLGGRPVPLCARCTGMYLGAALGLVYQYAVGRRRMGVPHWSIIAFLALLVGAFGIDGINSYLHFFKGVPTLYQSQNWLRLLTGTGMGLVLSVGLFLGFNQTIWKDPDPRPALDGWVKMAGLLALAGVIDLLVLSEVSWALYPLALISAAGVLILLTMIYSMVLVLLLRLDNRFSKALQILMPLTGGFAFALLQIIFFDAARYWLTGTWDGFHFG